MPVAIGTLGPGIKIEDFFTPVTQTVAALPLPLPLPLPLAVVAGLEKETKKANNEKQVSPDMGNCIFWLSGLIWGGLVFLSEEFWQGLRSVVRLAKRTSPNLLITMTRGASRSSELEQPPREPRGWSSGPLPSQPGLLSLQVFGNPSYLSSFHPFDFPSCLQGKDLLLLGKLLVCCQVEEVAINR